MVDTDFIQEMKGVDNTLTYAKSLRISLCHKKPSKYVRDQAKWKMISYARSLKGVSPSGESGTPICMVSIKAQLEKAQRVENVCVHGLGNKWAIAAQSPLAKTQSHDTHNHKEDWEMQSRIGLQG